MWRFLVRERFRSFVLIGGGTAGLWGVVWWALGVWQKGVLLLLAAAAFALSYALRRRLGQRWAENLAIGSALAGIVGLLLLTGGAGGFTIVWLYALPVATALLLRFRDTVVWGVVLMATTLLLWGVEAQGVRLPVLVPPAASPWIAQASGSWALLVVILLSWVYAGATQASLRQASASRRNLAALLHAIPDPLYSLRLEEGGFRCDYMNLPMVRLLGADLTGVHEAELARPDARMPPELLETSSRLLRNVVAGDALQRRQLRVRLPGGERLLEVHSQPLRSAQGATTRVVTLVRDLTEQTLSQQRLLQAARLAAVGEVVAGVAHELNNPLTVIKSGAQLLAEELDGEAAQDALAIEDSANRAAEIVRNLLDFARQTTPSRAPSSLNRIVERVVRLRSASLRAHQIELELALDEALPQLLADASRLEQVVLALVDHAEHALREAHQGGRVRLATECGAGVVRLCVANTGVGIEPEHLAHLFTPFYTTGSAADGRGLALAAAHGIVTDHGGTLTVESAPGRGTVFVLELPLAGSTPGVVPAGEDGWRPSCSEARAG